MVAGGWWSFAVGEHPVPEVLERRGGLGAHVLEFEVPVAGLITASQVLGDFPGVERRVDLPGNGDLRQYGVLLGNQQFLVAAFDPLDGQVSCPGAGLWVVGISAISVRACRRVSFTSLVSVASTVVIRVSLLPGCRAVFVGAGGGIRTRTSQGHMLLRGCVTNGFMWVAGV